MSESNLATVNQILQWDAQQALAWLQSMSYAQRGENATIFNWLGLAEGAADNARNHLELRWAQVAINAYEYLMNTAVTIEEQFNYQTSEMMLRAYLISALGPLDNDPILDASVIVRWFLNRLTFTREEAIELANLWRDQLRNQNVTEPLMDNVRKLRQLKHQLTALAVLAESKLWKPDERVSSWLAIRHLLP
jgi:hypothetical protein